MNYTTVIMAGGFGSRIQSITKQLAADNPKLYGFGITDIPKPMIPIDGVPVLER